MLDLAYWLGVTLVKGTMVLATALLLGAALRRAPGIARHRLWSVAFAGLLVLPALAAVLPALPLPVPDLRWDNAEIAAPAAGTPIPGAEVGERQTAGTTARAGDDSTAHPAPAAAEPHHAGDDRRRALGAAGHSGIAPRSATLSRLLGLRATASRPAVRAALLGLWLAGFAVAVGFLFGGMWRGGMLARRARPVTDGAWLRDLEWHRNFFGIRRRVRLLESPEARVPMTGGLLRPVVLLPEGASGWSPVRRRVVLLHELVHIHRHDVVRHLLARLAVALYWFHPLAWIAGRRSAIAREQACDEEVIRLGIKPSVYASHLLDLAATITPGRWHAAALPIIQRSQLETRLMTILDTKTRPRAAWTSALAAAVMLLTSVSAGMATPAPREPAARPGVNRTTQGLVGPAASSIPATAIAGGAAATAPAATIAGAQASSCWPDGANRIRGSFSGTISSSDRTGSRIINAVGTRDGDRIIQRWVDDLRLCMLVHGDVELEDDGARIGSVGNGGVVVLEAELDGNLQRLTIRNDGSGEQASWTNGGTAGQVDATVERWRDQMTATLADYARVTTLRGQRSSLRGEISSIRGQRSSLNGQISSIRGRRASLRGQISSLRGQVSSHNGRISSARGHISSLRGQISSARGHISSLRGQISVQRGAIQGLENSRYGANDEELAVISSAIRRREEAIQELVRQIEDYDVEARVAEIERQIAAYDLDRRIADIESQAPSNDIEAQVEAIERQIAALDVEGEVAEIERRIAELDVEGKVAEIEARIEALNVDERAREIEERLEPGLRELRRTIEDIGR